MRERAILFGQPRNLVGIMTSPEAADADPELPAVVLLNAGILHRVGPNRLHVNIARRLANAGFHSVRFDMSGIGDSGVRTDTRSFEKRAVQETQEAMDYLGGKTGTERYILIGICSGADVAFETARADGRVVGAYLINGSLLPVDALRDLYADASSRIDGRYYSGRLFDLRSWGRFITGKSDVKRAMRYVKRRIRLPRAGTGDATGEGDGSPDEDFAERWDPLIERSVDLELVFSEGSVTLDVFRLSMGRRVETLAERGLITLHVVKDTDHVFTLLWSQRQLIDMIHEWAVNDGRGWIARGRRTS
jgi:pimeloyl-ACP methyl ester carboxylesterase